MQKLILFVVSSMEIGGAEHVILTIMNGLNRSRFRPILVLGNKKGGYLDYVSKDIEIIDLQVKGLVTYIVKLIFLVRTKKPEVVFSCVGKLNIICAIVKILSGWKCLYVARESCVISQKLLKTKSKLVCILYRFFYRKLDVIIAQSLFMKNELQSYFKISDEKISVIGNPVNFYQLNKLFDGENPYQTDKIKLVSVGAMRAEKRFDMLVKVMSYLDDQYFLTIVGDGADRYKVLNAIETVGVKRKIQLIGMSIHPYHWIRCADFFMLSSEYDSFPNAILESLACGTPVIAFNCPGGISDIIVDGENGILVKERNALSFANAVRTATKMVWKKDEIIQQTKIKYDSKLIIRQIENLILMKIASWHKKLRNI